jgi:hypothetical protein
MAHRDEQPGGQSAGLGMLRCLHARIIVPTRFTQFHADDVRAKPDAASHTQLGESCPFIDGAPSMRSAERSVFAIVCSAQGTCRQVAGLRTHEAADSALAPTMAIELDVGGSTVRLFNTITTFGTPQDVGLQELRIEMSYPLDSESAAHLRILQGLAPSAPSAAVGW